MTLAQTTLLNAPIRQLAERVLKKLLDACLPVGRERLAK